MNNKSKLCTFATALALACSPAALAEEVDITLLLVSDIYEMDGSGSRGGFSRAAAVARNEKFFNDNVLYVHAGDTLSPSLMSTLDMGEHVVELLNIEPPDVFVPGNHEFDFGPEVFERLVLQKMKSEVFGANIRDANGNRVPGITDARIFTFEGVKVGVFGMISDKVKESSSPGDGYTFLPLIETARSTSKALREAGADIVVAVSHSSFSEDAQLVKDGAMDVLLTGDDHDLNLQFNGDVVMAETRSDAEYMVAVDLKVTVGERDGKRRVKWWPNFRVIDTIDYDPDTEVERSADVYRSRLEEELDFDIGAIATPLDTRRSEVRTSENAFGNLIADVMKDLVGADVGMTNGGGIRANREYPANTILTRRDILKELPFGNTVMLLELKGSVILEALENGISQVEETAGRFPHISGMTMTADLSQPAGSRVTELLIGGQPVDPEATYTLATNDYMAGGGDGYDMLESKTRVLLDADDSELMAYAVIRHIESQGSVSPTVEGRIKF